MIGFDVSIPDLQSFARRSSAAAEDAVAPTISKASSHARALASRDIRSSVNFTVSYLGQEGRLTAQRVDDDEAVITGRHRPTSLASRVFNRSSVSFGRRGRPVRVSVRRGGPVTALPGAFFVKLKSGNIGLAFRPKDGKPPSRGAVPIFGGAYLLYGPSVGQVAHDSFPRISGPLSVYMANEYIRNFERLFRG